MATPLSRERITQAALDLVDNGGLSALSMRKVAAVLDVEAMSLYRHVKNKADLLDALHDELVGRLPKADKGAWQDAIRKLAHAFRALMFAHPFCVPLLASRPASTPRTLAVAQDGIGVLMTAGWKEEDAVVAFQTVFCFVIGHGMFYTAGGTLAGDDPWAKQEFEQGLEALIVGFAAGR